MKLEAGRTYRVLIDHDAAARNMSALAHFERYTAGRGGQTGAENTISFAGMRLRKL